MLYTLFEPIRGVNTLHYLNQLIQNSPNRVSASIGVLADVFVFTYPIFLVYRFIIGYFCNKDKSDYYSVKIAINTGVMTIFNIIIQYFVFKERPIYSQGENLATILKELPTASFPSDHAAVSMMIGLSALYYGGISNNKLMKNVGYFWIVTSIIMGICRIMTGVHRPTDILAGWLGAYTIYCIIRNSKLVNGISDILLKIWNYISQATKLNKLISK